jgi:UDP-glucose 4-epimerase
MLAEFKRDSARKEVDRLQEEVKVKRSELDIFADTEDTTDGNTSTDYSKIRDLKLSRTEVSVM